MTERRRRKDSRAGAPDWAQLSALAESALRRRLAAFGELTPRAVAETVARSLPPSLGRRLWRELTRLGWLSRSVVVPLDALEDSSCPSALRGDWRPLVRLAVFGPAGQGLAYRDKHRQDLYQQLCAEIMATAVDTASLNAMAARTMSHPEVTADPTLGSMLRAFIAQRQAALQARLTPAEEHQRTEERSKLQRAFGGPLVRPVPSREVTIAAFGRLLREFDGYLAQFDERAAHLTLEKMREMRRQSPANIPAADLQRCEEQFDRLLKRAGTYRRQIRELAEQGAAAARAGEMKTAAWIVRRMEAIHMLLPTLLPDEQLRTVRDEIARCGDEHDVQEVKQELVQKQQEVAAKIKNLAGIIQRFHQVAERVPPTDEAYQRAEANYRWAVEQIRGLDTDWLSGLVLQLETLLVDLDDQSGQMQNQLDRFIGSVRTALNRLCLEIRAHQRARGAARGPAAPPPTDGAPPPAT